MPADHQRPAVWVGHIEMETDQLEASESFMIALGMRPIFKADETAILELRAATHLVLVANDDIEPSDASSAGKEQPAYLPSAGRRHGGGRGGRSRALALTRR